MYSKPLWCDDFKETVQRLLDGDDVAVTVRKAIREHRDACPPCCEFYDSLIQVSALSEDLLPPHEYEPVDEIVLLQKIVEDVSKT